MSRTFGPGYPRNSSISESPLSLPAAHSPAATNAPAKTLEDHQRESRMPIIEHFKKLLAKTPGLSPADRTARSKSLCALIGDLFPEANEKMMRAFWLADQLGLNDEAVDWTDHSVAYLFNFVLPELEDRYKASLDAKGPAH